MCLVDAEIEWAFGYLPRQVVGNLYAQSGAGSEAVLVALLCSWLVSRMSFVSISPWRRGPVSATLPADLAWPRRCLSGRAAAGPAEEGEAGSPGSGLQLDVTGTGGLVWPLTT